MGLFLPFGLLEGILVDEFLGYELLEEHVVVGEFLYWFVAVAV